MIADYFGIVCSKRCELLLAFAYLRKESSMVDLAHRIINDGEMSAIRLAESLSVLPRVEGELLARQTLEIYLTGTNDRGRK